MSQSLTKIYIHLIFHVKTTSALIRKIDLPRVHQYIGQLVNTTGCNVIRVGGIEDHVHILFAFNKNETIVHVVEEIKRNSSRWIKTIDNHYKQFAWQGGYAAFSVSQSMVNQTLVYISQQAEHHKKISFQEEYTRFLKLHHVDYDEQQVFTD